MGRARRGGRRSSIPITEEIDRISQLPEHVLIRILSLVPTKEVARAKLVSKAWRKLFEFLPSFTFDFPYPCSPPQDVSSLINAVDSALKLHRHLTLDKLRLSLHMDVIGSSSSSLIESWIDAALERKVEHLDLGFELASLDLDHLYLLPVKVFSARTITVLCLYECRLEIRGDIDLPGLRKLLLIKIPCQGDDHPIQKLISSCPLIQDLMTSCCYEMEWLHVSGLANLQRLTVFNCYSLQSIGIDAPSLQYFHYHLYEGSWPCDIVFTSSSNELLKELILSDDCDLCITEDFLQSLVYRFPNLEQLDILCCLPRIEISHNRLKRLHLRPTNAEAMLKIDTPNLRSLRYKGYRMPLISSVASLNTSSLQELDIQFLSFTVRNHVSILQSKEFFEKIWHCQDTELHLHVKSKLQLVIPRNLKLILSPPVYDIKHLKLTVDNFHRSQYIIDHMLWMCHPQTLSISRKTAPRFLKVLYSKLRNKEKHPKCCTSSTTKCWRHYLEKVQIADDTSRWEIGRIMTMPELSEESMICKIRFRLKWRS